jgi:hypothetical protein
MALGPRARQYHGPSECDIILLTNYIAGAPQQHRGVSGRGDPEPVDEYKIVITKAQRDMIVEALRHYLDGHDGSAE